MLKYIFAAIFIALAWAVVLVFHTVVPMWPAIVVTAVIVGGLLAYVIYKLVSARAAAAAIERSLREQASAHAGGIRPDLRAEISAMEAEFERAVQTLKSSKLGRTGRDALGLLPWYVMIGPSASGKTTAIRNSGIKMPVGKSAKVRGVGGTRNCDWWMTNEAILLDTAGRWSTDEDDRDEWLAFLDVLKRTRPEEADQRHPAGRRRARPDRLARGDRRPGGQAARAHRRGDRPAGHGRPRLPDGDEVRPAVRVHRDVRGPEGPRPRANLGLHAAGRQRARRPRRGVRAALRRSRRGARAVHRPAHGRGAAGRGARAHLRVPAAVRFAAAGPHRPGRQPVRPERLPGRAHHARRLLHQRHAGGAAHRPRHGQHGRGVRRAARRCVAASTTKPKSYFVRDLFQQVVFPDAAVAVRSTRGMRRQRAIRWLTATVALAISAAFLALPISSYLKNTKLVDDGRAFVEHLSEQRGDAVLSSPRAGPGRTDGHPAGDAGDQRAGAVARVRPLPRRRPAGAAARGRRAAAGRAAAAGRGRAAAGLRARTRRRRRSAGPKRAGAGAAADAAEGRRRAGARERPLERQVGRRLGPRRPASSGC